ncbi:MAG: phenylalanine--tRNA ligase subunit beta, partial [Planctomycetota bacterium]|nr:phenylalanine--tRNA ligase subunit beta [Planctomycetota bacterium]
MILSYRWLTELVDLGDRTPDEVAEIITFHIAEVEEVEHVGAELADVVVGHVTSVEPHPDADRLRVCTVDAGPVGTHTVVCGAPNVAAGQRICFAPVGTTVQGPDGPIVLERRAIRGVESAGMICAEDELGLGEDHSGILVLPEDAPVGEPIGEALRLTDTLIDIGNTAITHRPDLWGHVGFARDLGAVLRAEVRYPDAGAAESALEAAEGEPYDVTIEDEEGCRRYLGLALDGVTNGQAPLWMRRRLELCGVRSIDLLVDLTNYVLLEQGQPLHAFDLRHVRGDKIVVRRGRDGEVLRSLDGVERPVGPEDVVIADAERPVALAGVMGGEDSGMVGDTTALLLEAAT